MNDKIDWQNKLNNKPIFKEIQDEIDKQGYKSNVTTHPNP